MANTEVIEQWVAALESGEYEQGRQFLRNGDEFCCLGILCELAVADGAIPAPEIDSSGLRSYGTAQGGRMQSVLPVEVQTYLGTLSCDPAVTSAGGANTTLSVLNDGGVSFSEIAKVIRNNFLVLVSV